GRVARVLFYGEGRFIVTGILLAGLVNWRKFWKPEFTFFGLVLAFYWAAFSLIGFLPRYVMPVLPFMCVAASWAIYVIFRTGKAAQYAITCMASLIFVGFFYRASESGNFETNMQHEKAADVCRRLTQYLEGNFSDALIASDWPVSAYLRYP